MAGHTKTVIVGTGKVGCAIAFTMVNQGIGNEIVLIDINKDKAYAEAMDMQHAVYFMPHPMTVRSGEYTDCKDADLVVITAAAPMDPNAGSRLDMLKPSMNIIRSVVGSVMASGFHGIFLVVSNPVDVIAYYVWKLSGLPAKQVIGSGTTLDSARLCTDIAAMYNVDTDSVNAFVVGEHGDSEFVMWNNAQMGGKPVKELWHGQEAEMEKKFHEQAIQDGHEIFHKKGNTCYGIGASVTAIARAIFRNERRVYPVSVNLNGTYGLTEDVYMSMPVVLDYYGVREIGEMKLSEDETISLHHAVDLLTSFYKDLEL